MRTIINGTDTLPLLGLRQWLLSDHIGSTSVTANADGSRNSEIRYTAFGEIRAKNGITPTNRPQRGTIGPIPLDSWDLHPWTQKNLIPDYCFKNCLN